MMPTRVQDIQQHHLSAASGNCVKAKCQTIYNHHHHHHRSGRDGGHYGGGGCGGLEVFAFLAFLLALLDLFLDVNELAVDIDVNTERRTRRAHFSSPAGCTVGPCDFLRISLLYFFYNYQKTSFSKVTYCISIAIKG
ncbi:hypothetical protein E2C01_092153 [Portunus trituberculatus]|uniref:Uncharacterized protein n=1 Tax=Portunus trituberculatus TaxID=210409 RepID=A0A5B7JQZ9_PORTR|nr:hypothetical protein [Portunus trituberculatus]